MIDLFLAVIALLWLAAASFQDWKKREVANWLSFSLIIFVVGYRLVYSVVFNDLSFLLYGLLGLGVFIILGYLFYYGRIFAGGDAKLLFGLGAVLPLSSSIYENFMIFFLFVFLILLAGSVYGIFWSIFLVLRNRKKFWAEFNGQFKTHVAMTYLFIITSTVSILLAVFKEYFLILIPIIILFFPLLYLYAKSIEESCMVQSVPASKLTEGDWLYEKIKVRGKIIEPNWEGLSLKELKLLKNYRGKIKIKAGIPFVPVFLIAFILLLIFGNAGLSLFG